jgi:hypothetical protein
MEASLCPLGGLFVDLLKEFKSKSILLTITFSGKSKRSLAQLYLLMAYVAQRNLQVNFVLSLGPLSNRVSD